MRADFTFGSCRGYRTSVTLEMVFQVVAEGLRRDIYPAVMSKCAALRAIRKNQLNELHTVQGSLNSAVDNMIKHQKSYV